MVSEGKQQTQSFGEPSLAQSSGIPEWRGRNVPHYRGRNGPYANAHEHEQARRCRTGVGVFHNEEMRRGRTEGKARDAVMEGHANSDANYDCSRGESIYRPVERHAQSWGTGLVSGGEAFPEVPESLPRRARRDVRSSGVVHFVAATAEHVNSDSAAAEQAEDSIKLVADESEPLQADDETNNAQYEDVFGHGFEL